jgi:hypothetical protein
LENERLCHASITVSDAYLELRSRNADTLAELSDNAVVQLCSYAALARLPAVIALLLSDLPDPGQELTPALLVELRQGTLANEAGARVQRALEAMLAAAGSSAALLDDPGFSMAFLGPASSWRIIAGVRSLDLILTSQHSQRLLCKLAESYSLGVASRSALDDSLLRALVSAVLAQGDVGLFPALEVYLALLGSRGSDEPASWKDNWRKAKFPSIQEAGLLVEYYLDTMARHADDPRAAQQCRESALRIIGAFVERAGLGQTLLERAAEDAGSCEGWLDELAVSDEARRSANFAITVRAFCVHAFIASSLWTPAREACVRLIQELADLRSAASSTSADDLPARHGLPELCGSLARRVVFATTRAGSLSEAIEACASLASALLLEPEKKPGPVTQEVRPDRPHLWLDELLDAVSRAGEDELNGALSRALSRYPPGSLCQLLNAGRTLALLACVPARKESRMTRLGSVLGLWDERLDPFIDEHFEESLRARVVAEVARCGAKDLTRQLWLRWTADIADGSSPGRATSGVVQSVSSMLSVVRLFAGPPSHVRESVAPAEETEAVTDAHPDQAFATRVLERFTSSRPLGHMDEGELSAVATAFFALNDPNSAFEVLAAMLRRDLVPSLYNVHNAVRELGKVSIDRAVDILAVYGESTARKAEETSHIAAIYQTLLTSVAIQARYDLVPKLLASEEQAGVHRALGVLAAHVLIEQFEALDRAANRRERNEPMRIMRDLVRTCVSNKEDFQLEATLLNAVVSKASTQLRAFAPPPGESGPAQARWLPYGAHADTALRLLRLVSGAGLAYTGTALRVMAAVRSHWDYRRRKESLRAGGDSSRILKGLRVTSLLQIDELVGTVRWGCRTIAESPARLSGDRFRHMAVNYLALDDVDGAIEVMSWMRELGMSYEGDPLKSRFLQDLRRRAEEDADLAETRLLRLAGDIATPHTKLWWERVTWETSIPQD